MGPGDITCDPVGIFAAGCAEICGRCSFNNHQSTDCRALYLLLRIRLGKARIQGSADHRLGCTPGGRTELYGHNCHLYRRSCTFCVYSAGAGLAGSLVCDRQIAVKKQGVK